MPDLESEIAKRKCAMFGQLCRLDPRYTVKRLFLHRLTSHFVFNDILYGFVVDTLKIISDLGLEGYVLTFLNTGDFPSKYVWKKQVRMKLDIIVNRTFSSEIQHENIVRFLSMNTLSRPNRFWYLCRKRPKLLAACKCVVKTISLLFTRYNRSVCSVCGADVEFYGNHRVLWCPIYQGVRQNFWNLLWHNFGVDIYLRLSSMNDDAILNVMFGAFDMVADTLNTNSEETFIIL